MNTIVHVPRSLPAKHKHHFAFTLIELTIVLVIIGLIVGGVLVGRDLIKAADVRAQVTQIEKYNQAVNTFRGKYGYLPGDIPNPVAGQFGFQSPRGQYAGEGDGNGLIEANKNNTAGANSAYYPLEGEQAMFWVDLSTAHLIDGSFSTATPTALVNTLVTGTQIDQYMPRSKIGSGHVYVWSGGWPELQAIMGSGGSAAGDMSNYFAVDGVTGAGAGWHGNVAAVPLITPAQAYAIDKKVDDGLPQSGTVLALDLWGPWSAGGPIMSGPGFPYENNEGDFDHVTGGPVTTGDGVATSGYNQNVTTTCYDNNAIAGAPENYSIQNNYVNCVLSFRFQ